MFFLNLCDKIYFGIISECYLAEVTINLLRITTNIMYLLMVRTCIYLFNIFDHKKSNSESPTVSLIINSTFSVNNN